MNSQEPIAPRVEETKRVIKRYSNRKLYDTQESRYVTLLQIAEMVRAGEDVQVVDNATKEDKTDITLALIISEELKTRPRGVPLATLKALIRHRGEKILSQLREGPIGRLIPRDDEHNESETADGAEGGVEQVESETKGLRATLESWQHAMDDRLRAVVPNFSVLRELEQQVKAMAERLDRLEKRLEETDGRRKPE